MDLNADLGEGFGIWRLGDDDALLDLVTSANVACGFHGGDAVHHAPGLRRRRRARGRRRRPGRLPGPGRLRPPAHRVRLRRPARRGHLPARRAGRASAGRSAPGSATSSRTARSTTRRPATRRRPPPWSPRSAATTTNCRCSARPARSWPSSPRGAGLRVVAEGFADRDYLPNGSLVPAHRARRAGHRPGEVAARAVRMATERTVVAVDGTRCPARSSRSACTATPRARSPRRRWSGPR